MIQSHKELIVWQKAVELATQTYLLTEQFPKEELYGLTSQMRRASVSVASNIAEGKNRGTRKDFVQFLRMSKGSLAELETQIEIAKKIKNLSALNYNDLEILISEIGKILNVIIKKLLEAKS